MDADVYSSCCIFHSDDLSVGTSFSMHSPSTGFTFRSEFRWAGMGSYEMIPRFGFARPRSHRQYFPFTRRFQNNDGVVPTNRSS